MTREKPLSGKVALVTGSTGGIGEAIARRFAAEGAVVVVHGIDHENGERVASEICAGGGSGNYIGADLAVPEECQKLIAAIGDSFGGLNIIVNNAADTRQSTLETTDATLFDRMMAVNVRAPLFLVKAAMPLFRAAGRGNVLNIGSVNAYCGEHELLDYSISKGGLMTMTRNLADTLGPEGVRVNQLNLGWVLTEREYKGRLAGGHPPDWPQRVPARFAPSGDLLTPDQIAHYALAFVDPAGGFVTGTVLELEQYPVIGRNPSKEPDA